MVWEVNGTEPSGGRNDDMYLPTRTSAARSRPCRRPWAKTLSIVGAGGAGVGWVGAFDANNGENLWRTYTIPGPGEPDRILALGRVRSICTALPFRGAETRSIPRRTRSLSKPATPRRCTTRNSVRATTFIVAARWRSTRQRRVEVVLPGNSERRVGLRLHRHPDAVRCSRTGRRNASGGFQLVP